MYILLLKCVFAKFTINNIFCVCMCIILCMSMKGQLWLSSVGTVWGLYTPVKTMQWHRPGLSCY